MKIQDYYTLPQAALLMGKGQATLYRWVNQGKINYTQFGGILFLSYATIQMRREKHCSNCYHHLNNGYCGCRSSEDIVNPCSDWYPIELKS